MLVVSIQVSAGAQTHKTMKRDFNENYSVCSNASGYYVCTVAQLHAQNQKHQAPLAKMDTHTEMVDIRSANGLTAAAENPYTEPFRYHKFIIGGDQMDNPGNGLPSQQYDGPTKNDQRNMNVNQTSMHLPPIDGNNSK